MQTGKAFALSHCGSDSREFQAALMNEMQQANLSKNLIFFKRLLDFSGKISPNLFFVACLRGYAFAVELFCDSQYLDIFYYRNVEDFFSYMNNPEPQSKYHDVSLEDAEKISSVLKAYFAKMVKTMILNRLRSSRRFVLDKDCLQRIHTSTDPFHFGKLVETVVQQTWQEHVFSLLKEEKQTKKFFTEFYVECRNQDGVKVVKNIFASDEEDDEQDAQNDLEEKKDKEDSLILLEIIDKIMSEQGEMQISILDHTSLGKTICCNGRGTGFPENATNLGALFQKMFPEFENEEKEEQN